MIVSLLAILKGLCAIGFVFGSIVLVHEFGHYITAKLTGIWVIEFSLGFGKRLLKLCFGETVYSIRVFPLGGFVRLAGMDTPEDGDVPEGGEKKDEAISSEGAAPAKEEPPKPPEVDDEEKIPELAPDDPRGYPSKPWWAKILVLSAGSIMNLVWAVLVFFLMYSALGGAVSNILVSDVTPGEPAAIAGLKAGDVVRSVKGITVKEWTQGIAIIKANGGQEIELDVVRDHPLPHSGFGGGLLQRDEGVSPGTYELFNRETLKLRITPLGGPGTGRIGIKLGPNNYDFQVLDTGHAVQKAWESTVGIISQTLSGLVRMISRETEADVAGPVKIMQMINQQSRKGLPEVLYLTALLSINIGLLNLMPFPVLDGGRILFLLIEMLFRFINLLTGLRLAMNPKWEENIHLVGMIFLLLMLVVVTFNDIRNLFN